MKIVPSLWTQPFFKESQSWRKRKKKRKNESKKIVFVFILNVFEKVWKGGSEEHKRKEEENISLRGERIKKKKIKH